jgi:hypothetical protein
MQAWPQTWSVEWCEGHNSQNWQESDHEHAISRRGSAVSASKPASMRSSSIKAEGHVDSRFFFFRQALLMCFYEKWYPIVNESICCRQAATQNAAILIVEYHVFSNFRWGIDLRTGRIADMRNTFLCMSSLSTTQATRPPFRASSVLAITRFSATV